MKSVLITGASFGLGLAMARHFLDRGFTVHGCGRTEANVASAARELPAMKMMRADVAVAADRERLLQAATAAGDLDILVNNAAIVRAHDYTNDFTLAADRARDEIEINFAAPVELTRMFLHWRRRAGRDDLPAIVANIGTPGALFPLEANMMYSASKAGFHMFTLALRRQMRGTPVKVCEVFPPALDTNLANQLDVANQVGQGAEVIDACARNSVEAILAGQEVILPHPDAASLVEAMAPRYDEQMLDYINSRVRRRPGWDRP
ncbi:MAG: SDR family NAD(P)-dependent oxidoreductase [Gammaproteobacteria bacterium]